MDFEMKCRIGFEKPKSVRLWFLLSEPVFPNLFRLTATYKREI